MPQLLREKIPSPPILTNAAWPYTPNILELCLLVESGIHISIEVAERLNSSGPEVSEFKDIVGIIRTESTPVYTTPGLFSLDIAIATYLVDVFNAKLLYCLGPKLYGP